MGMDSDLVKAKKLFPLTRRAIMYTPMDFMAKSLVRLQADLEKIACEYGPCDIVLADIESDASDAKILAFIELCSAISRRYGSA